MKLATPSSRQLAIAAVVGTLVLLLPLPFPVHHDFPWDAIPGFYELEINASVRHDDYSDVGNTTNPKFGVNWSPIDGLRLRGSYGTSFRAPTIPEIYGNSNNLFVQNYQNPAGGAQIQGVALSGQNLDLDPETVAAVSRAGDSTEKDRGPV